MSVYRIKRPSNRTTQEKERRPLNIRNEIISWVIWVAGMLIAVFLVREFVFTMARVDGVSMMPTLHNGDRLVAISKLYTLERGDIIIFRPRGVSDKLYIKRIIALEGQTVEVDAQTGSVYVDEQLADEPYISEATNVVGDVPLPAQVPPGHVFVMGDNRNHSMDSRMSEVGMVDVKSIRGEAVLRLWPPLDIGFLYTR